MVCGAMVNSIIIVAISESFILGGIGGGWSGTLASRRLCCPEVDDGIIDCDVLGSFL